VILGNLAALVIMVPFYPKFEVGSSPKTWVLVHLNIWCHVSCCFDYPWECHISP